MKTRNMMTKAALCIFVPGILTMPEDLTRKLKHGSKEEVIQKQEIERWMRMTEEKVMTAIEWLQKDGYIICETVTYGEWLKLKPREQAEYVKISTVLGGLYSAHCEVRDNHAEAQLAGSALKKDSGAYYVAPKNPAAVIEDYRKAYTEWNSRRIWYKMVTDGRLSERKFNALMIERGFFDVVKGKKVASKKKLREWLGKAPVMPDVVENTHIKLTVQITLINRTEVTKVKKVKKQNAKAQVVTKKREEKKFVEKVVEVKVVDLPDEISKKEIPAVIDAVVSRFPRGGGLPEWTHYSWELMSEVEKKKGKK